MREADHTAGTPQAWPALTDPPPVQSPSALKVIISTVTIRWVPVSPIYDARTRRTLRRPRVCAVRCRPAPGSTGTHRELVVQGSARWRTGEESPAPTLGESGSRAFAIAPPSFFLSGTLQPARKPLAITSVGRDAVAGGTMGALLDLTGPVRDRHGVERF